MSGEAKEWSISALAKELGLDRRTVSRRVADISPCRQNKVGKLYKMRDVAVPILMPGFGGDLGQSEGIQSLELERAKLAHFQALEKELTIARIRGSSLDRDDVEGLLVGVVLSAKSQLMGMGAKLRQKLVDSLKDGPDAVQEIIDSEIEEVLKGLANTDIGSALDLPPTGNSGNDNGGLESS